LRQVLGDEALTGFPVNTIQPDLRSLKPTGEVTDAAKVNALRVRGVPLLD
jgi:hypothetical protein